MHIPLGFRFNPTDEELIRCFLYAKVVGLRLPWDGVTSRCVYGENAEPWNVFSDADDVESSYYWHTKKEGGNIKKTIYVFTSITKSAPKAKDSKRAARIAGCGTWSGQTGPKDIIHNETGDTIGYSRMLTFKAKKEKMIDEDVVGHWIMHEYSLSDSTLRMAGRTHNDIVLCKITRCIKSKKESYSTFEDGPQVHQIQQTAAAAEAVQYYSPENTAGEGDHVNNNNNKRCGGSEEEILEMQQEEEEGWKKQKSSSNSNEIENIYDLPFVDFGDIDVSNLPDLPSVDIF